jgi:putative nucleotidyltransferase with HDIG domain
MHLAAKKIRELLISYLLFTDYLVLFAWRKYMAAQKRILLIGKNDKQNKYLLSFLLNKSFEVDEAESYNDATIKLLSSNNYTLVLIRFTTFNANTLSIIHNIKSFNPHLGIMLLTNLKKPDLPVSLLDKGMIDYVSSPDNLAGIYSALKNESKKTLLIQKNNAYKKQLNRYKHEEQKNTRKTLDLEEIYDSTLENLMTALDLRDVETFGHSQTVAKYSLKLACLLGIEDKETMGNIKKGALLHDIGKIAIPDTILKKPGALSPTEWEKIKQHPSLGFGLIKEIKLVKEVGNIILFHHERYDGKGYPKQLKNKNIPSEARIFALADALDAITSHRPYREERTFSYAKKEIQKHSGTQFDPKVVEAFCSFPLEKWEKIRFETTKIMPFFEDMMRINQ